MTDEWIARLVEQRSNLIQARDQLIPEAEKARVRAMSDGAKPGGHEAAVRVLEQIPGELHSKVQAVILPSSVDRDAIRREAEEHSQRQAQAQTQVLSP